MRRFFLFILFCSNWAQAGNEGCGTFQIAGILKRASSHTQVLEVYPETHSRLEIVLDRVSGSDWIQWSGRPVRIEVFIERGGLVPGTFATVLKPLMRISRRDVLKNPIQKISAAPCR